MRHIMVDLETLDTAHTAVVLSIGAVAFECGVDQVIDRELDPTNFLYAELEIRDQQRARRTLSTQTVTWWMQQGEDARSLFARGRTRFEPAAALTSFNSLVQLNVTADDGPLIWGNGSDFDNQVLLSLMEAYRIKPAWPYRNNRCYRTLKGLLPDIELERTGTHHNALDDAITQARHLQKIVRALGSPI
jgi:hypothetical protein